MEYKIIHKDALQVIGVNRKMITKNNEHWKDIPKFWDDFKRIDLQGKLNSYALNDLVFAITTYCEEPNCFFTSQSITTILQLTTTTLHLTL